MDTVGLPVPAKNLRSFTTAFYRQATTCPKPSCQLLNILNKIILSLETTLLFLGPIIISSYRFVILNVFKFCLCVQLTVAVRHGRAVVHKLRNRELNRTALFFM